MSKITDEEKQKICKLFEEGSTTSQIAKNVGRSKDSVIKVLNKSGYSTSRDILKILSEEEIDDICQMYLSKTPTQKIVDKYNVKFKSQNTVIKVIKSRGIKPRTTGHAPIIRDENFFEVIDSEEKAYILGLLIADGYVIYPKTRRRTPCWGITLHKQDKYMIEKIKNIIGIEKKICEERNEASITVVSQKMVDDLAKYGVIPQKSFKTFFPIINKEYEKDLIRGIFDGDGCISNGVCSFYGNEPLLIDIQKTLFKSVNIPIGKITKRYSNGADSFSFGSKKSVSNFYHYIYDEANVFLKRKYEKFKELDIIYDKC